MKYRFADTAVRLLLAATALLMIPLIIRVPARADYVVFSDSFNDGNWTAGPGWQDAPADSSVSITNARFTSSPYSLKIAANNNTGAIRALSGLSSATQPYTSTFNLYIESMGDEAIPWCLQSTGNGIVAVIFLLQNGRPQLFVSNSADKFSGISADVPYQLSYGQWHSFKITFDGSTTNLYLDGHTQPDASVTQPYIGIPAKICVGNFSMPHTSTIYMDDLTIATSAETRPAKVYVQICSDTSTDGLSLNSHYMTFPDNDWSYTSPSGQAAQVMAESYRNSHRDSLGNPIKFTWYMLCGSMYGYGNTTGPLLPFELMQDNHGDEIERWGDEMAYHYHSWVWNDPDGDGVYHWNQASNFVACVDDFDKTLAHLVLDRNFYPSSFRSGWHGMDNFYQSYLDDWIPYRFENDYPNVRTDTTEPIDNVYDWSRAPSAWAPYHPAPDDYQSPGSLRGWDSRSKHMNSLSNAMVQDAFIQAQGGTPQLMTLFSHLKESDFPAQVDRLHNKLMNAHNALPLVEFEYLTGRECMLKWRNGTDVTPPNIVIASSDNVDLRTITITTDEPIYQKQPFIARKGADGSYSRIDCTAIGPNSWSFQFRPADTTRMAAALTDWFGNSSVKFLQLPLQITNVKTTVTSTTAEITWESSSPSDTLLQYRLRSTGSLTTVYDAKRTLFHKVSLSGLQPARAYLMNLSGQDEFNQRASVGNICILTRPSDPIITDNTDSGFSVSGNWSTGNTAAGRYGSDYRYVSATPTNAAYASWSGSVPYADVYKVYAWWSEGANRSSSATYSVLAGGITYSKVVNQQIDGGKWNLLGTYSLNAGDNITAKLSGAAPSGYVIIADAVKIEQAYATVDSIALARLLPDGSGILLANATVSAVFGGEFYVQDSSGSYGIKVKGTGVSEGDCVDICGTLSTSAGERQLIDAIIKPCNQTQPKK